MSMAAGLRRPRLSPKQRRQQALNRHFRQKAEKIVRDISAPMTAPERLRQIVEEHHVRRRIMLDGYEEGGPALPFSEMVLHAAVRHPNMPPDLMAELLRPCRDAFCENPVVPLLALEEPTFLDRCDSDDLRWLLRSPLAPAPIVGLIAAGLPSRLLEPARAREDLAEEARLHVSFAGETEQDAPLPSPEEGIKKVGDYWRGYVRERVEKAGGNDADRHACAEMAEVGVWPSWLGPAPVVRLPDAAADRPCPDMLEPETACAVRQALDPQTPAAELARLTADWRWEVRLAVAHNPSTSPELLKDHARSAYLSVFRRVVARHPNTDEELLLSLACDPADALTRRIARRHPGATARVITASRAHVLASARHELRSVVPAPPTPPPLVRLLALIDTRIPAPVRYDTVDSLFWWERLAAALTLRPARIGKTGAVWTPKARAWLAALSGDGNTLVRAAAKARLSGSDSCLLF